MSEKPSVGALIQIQLLKQNLQSPKWKSTRKRGMSIIGGYWDEKGEKREIQKVKDKIAEHQIYLLQIIKDDFYVAKTQLEKKKAFNPGVEYGVHLITIGSLAVLGFEDLLLNPQIMDEQFIHDIENLIKEEESREAAAFALLGLELANKSGRFLPLILEVFDETQSLRLASYLGKVTWDSRVVDSLVRGTSGNFLTTEMDGLSLKSYDGVGLLSALSLLELNDERGVTGMVINLLQLKDSQLPDQLLVYAGDAAVAGLIESLKQENINNSRARAAACLGEISNKQAIKPLLDTLQDENEFCVIAAAKALCKFGDPAAIPGLLQILRHKSLLVRKAGSSCLKKLKNVWTSEPFIKALADVDETVVLFAIEAIGGMKSKAAIEPLTRLVASENKKVKKSAEKVLKKIS